MFTIKIDYSDPILNKSKQTIATLINSFNNYKQQLLDGLHDIDISTNEGKKKFKLSKLLIMRICIITNGGYLRSGYLTKRDKKAMNYFLEDLNLITNDPKVKRGGRQVILNIVDADIETIRVQKKRQWAIVIGRFDPTTGQNKTLETKKKH